jgi:hypothetical protein
MPTEVEMRAAPNATLTEDRLKEIVDSLNSLARTARSISHQLHQWRTRLNEDLRKNLKLSQDFLESHVVQEHLKEHTKKEK